MWYIDLASVIQCYPLNHINDHSHLRDSRNFRNFKRTSYLLPFILSISPWTPSLAFQRRTTMSPHPLLTRKLSRHHRSPISPISPAYSHPLPLPHPNSTVHKSKISCSPSPLKSAQGRPRNSSSTTETMSASSRSWRPRYRPSSPTLRIRDCNGGRWSWCRPALFRRERRPCRMISGTPRSLIGL